jgi:hypothetical protein
VKELRKLRGLFPKHKPRTLALRVARNLPGKASQASKARRLVDKLKAEDRAIALATAQRASLPPAIAALVAVDERMQAEAQRWLDQMAQAQAAGEALVRPYLEAEENMQKLIAKYSDLFKIV